MKSRIPFSRIFRVVRTLVVLAFFIVVVTLAMVWLAGGFKDKIKSTGLATMEATPYSGPTASVRRLSLPLTEEAVGSVKAVREMVITSRVAARITELALTAGQQVSQNDILVRLDDRDLQARVAQTKAALDGARATRDQAQIDYTKIAAVYAQRAASKTEFDRADLTLKNAESDLVRASEVVKEAQAMLEYTTIRAPATGVVVDKKVNVGDTVMPGQVLATLYDPTHMQLVASVRETLTQRLKVGQAIGVRMDALGRTCEGSVAEIVPQAEGASRTFQVKVTGPCPPGIYSGMFGRIIIPLDARDVLLIPVAAVSHVGQLDLVDCVENGRLQRRIVQLGRTLAPDVEVLSGLREGESVALRSAVTLPAVEGAK